MTDSRRSEITLRELFRGKGAHVDPVACVEGLTAEPAGRRAEGLPHSIWQLVSHMNYWMDYELKRIHEQRPPYPAHADGSWPSTPAPANESEWTRTAMIFRALIEELSALADGSDLDRPVESMEPGEGSSIYSVRDVLWQTMVHNSYHVGQIVLVRSMVGSWPPQAGGDTW
jgi:uncharacterized damage-inducible protein DinB